MKKFDTVFFDLDGTLTDPGEGITNSAAFALKHFGIEVEDRRELYPFIGPPLLESFIKYYAFTTEDARKAIDFYRIYYVEHGINENLLYDEVPELLQKLKDDGIKIVMATSKPEEFAKKIAERFKIAEFFDLIAGAGMDETRTKKDEVIAYALETLGNPDVSRTLMVGDRSYDVIGAGKFGIPTVGVLYGYGSKEELENAGAFLTVKTPLEIYEKLF